MLTGTDNFSAAEVNGASSQPIPDSAANNLQNITLPAAEQLRAVFGVPFRLTSAYRNVAHNEAVGGAIHSAHVVGLAIDGVPQGLTVEAMAAALLDAQAGGTLPAFDQIILYADGHVHLGMSAVFARRQLEYSMAPGQYEMLADMFPNLAPGPDANPYTQAVSEMADDPTVWALLVALGLVLFWPVIRRSRTYAY